MKAEINNSVRIYQQFCDRNVELKNREDELLHSISILENKRSEFEKTISELKQHVSKLQENDIDNSDVNAEVKLEDTILTNNGSLEHPIVTSWLGCV